ncbi:MAG: flagellar brake protein [Bacillus sp. (in: firmicutes)]
MKIGTTLTIEPKYSSVAEQYRTKVLDSDEQTLFIDYPVNIKTNKVIFLADGAQLRITYYSGRWLSQCL